MGTPQYGQWVPPPSWPLRCVKGPLIMGRLQTFGHSAFASTCLSMVCHALCTHHNNPGCEMPICIATCSALSRWVKQTRAHGLLQQSVLDLGALLPQCKAVVWSASAIHVSISQLLYRSWAKVVNCCHTSSGCLVQPMPSMTMLTKSNRHHPALHLVLHCTELPAPLWKDFFPCRCSASQVVSILEMTPSLLSTARS